MGRVRAAVALLAVAVAVLASAAPASAKSFSLPAADVEITVEPDGSVRVVEHLTYAFSGTFQGGYREIPLRSGESLDGVGVREGASPYSPGASAELGSSGRPGTFGVADLGDRVRIVWHYAATDELRTFTVQYRIRGLAVGYDDVVDVDLQVWGDEWQVGLGRLTATMTGPGDVQRAWGHPAWVRGDVAFDGPTAVLRALNVGAGQFVELRALYPRGAFTSDAGMRVERGAGLDAIVAAEQADADEFRRDQDRIDDAKANPLRTLLVLLVLAASPAALVIAVVWWRYGREPTVDYDREYEQEPPTDTEPALVPALLSQGGGVGSYEFTATLFDLIRRGVYVATPTTTERRTWAGLRREAVADLEISAGESEVTPAPTPFERSVMRVVDGVIGSGPEHLSEFRHRIEDQRTAMSAHFTKFKEHVATAAHGKHWFRSGGVVTLVVALVVFVLLGALLVYLAANGWRPVSPRWSDVVLAAVGGASLVNAALIVVALTQHRLWRKRTPAARLEAERWLAFRRFLTDFPRLDEAPPASIALWERYLVYGIAFGIADRVLQGAHLYLTEEQAAASSIYWISPHPGSGLGSGASAMAIGDLASGFGSALAPPSSGGGGGGGGGGGAW